MTKSRMMRSQVSFGVHQILKYPVCKGQNNQSFAVSACIAFTSFHSNQSLGLTGCVLYHGVKVPVTSSIIASCSAIGMLVCQPVALINKIKADLDFRDLQCQSFNNIELDSVFSDFRCQLFFINIEAYS